MSHFLFGTILALLEVYSPINYREERKKPTEAFETEKINKI